MIFSPPNLEELAYGHELVAGNSKSIVIADLDFETYSECGYEFDGKKFTSLKGSFKKGLSAVGAAKYSEHFSTEVLSLAYNLKNGRGKKLWIPGDSLPVDLFEHLWQGKLIEAWNCSFENWIWKNVCVKKYNFPSLPENQLRDAMAKSRAFGLPGSLDKASEALRLFEKKDARGKRLLQRLSVPQNKKILEEIKKQELKELYEYNLQDIATEAEASSLIPDLSDNELEFWKCDRAINSRGVKIDVETISSFIKIIEQAYEKYIQEFKFITCGEVFSPFQVLKFLKWLRAQGIKIDSLAPKSIKHALREEISLEAKRALEIRAMICSASVKKLYAMRNQVCENGRLHDLFIYHSARTGRAAGAGVQPQNLPNHGVDVNLCEECSFNFGISLPTCPQCHSPVSKKITEWNEKSVEDAIKIAKFENLEIFEKHFGESINVISGCLRAMFIADKDRELVCSDYSAIEAVVLAAISREEWRLEVFRTHGKIYEMSASKITGIPFEEFERYKKEMGQHHPMRKKIGKIAELASGYGGWIGSWKEFGAGEYFTDDEIKNSVMNWRAASPNIVNLWKGLENAAMCAINFPGKEFDYNSIKYRVSGGVLYCKLLSGRNIVYHEAGLEHDIVRGRPQIAFSGWNTNPKNGKIGWQRLRTYGGKLTENVVQATARDLLAHAVVKLEKMNFPVVLHVHDEIVCELPKNSGGLEILEKIMCDPPEWAHDWPIKAGGGWTGTRYKK